MTIQNASQVRNWSKAWLRAVAWHPNFPKLALALQDDSVRLCEMGEDVMPLLRCPEQKNVSSVSWRQVFGNSKLFKPLPTSWAVVVLIYLICCLNLLRPYTHFQLAVGVGTGIVIWQLERGNKIKPAASQSRFLSMKNHFPVTCVEYSHSVSLPAYKYILVDVMAFIN